MERCSAGRSSSLLAFQTRWLDADTLRALAARGAPEPQSALPRPWASNAPDPAAARESQPVYYPNCAAARAAGAAPIMRCERGYRPPLDRDGDGMACEPYRGGRWTGTSPDRNDTLRSGSPRDQGIGTRRGPDDLDLDRAGVSTSSACRRPIHAPALRPPASRRCSRRRAPARAACGRSGPRRGRRDWGAVRTGPR